MPGENFQPEAEKLPLSDDTREFLITQLNISYRNGTPLSIAIQEFELCNITRRERDSMILQSDYNLDDKTVSVLTLF